MCTGTNPDGYHADDSVGDCGKWKAKLEKADAEKLLNRVGVFKKS